MIQTAPRVQTVTELTELIRIRLESDSHLSHCFVTGEISNFKHHSSGHMYFTLKDEKSRIRAIMFSSRNRNLTFLPEDGMRVICTGSIGVFERDGQYQIYVDDMQPDGVGALYVAFAQLKDKLGREGLFDLSRKRALPAFPRRIGVVTSPTGAVIRDICSTLQRRYPLARAVLSPALVQGPGAAASIVSALDKLLALKNEDAVDVIIVGRGGGSLEELWPFNEEPVARAISRSSVPIISAVGHETDVTICDFVADVRAATPTAAAELVAPNIQDLTVQLGQFRDRMATHLLRTVNDHQNRLRTLTGSAALQQPLRRLEQLRQHVDFLEAQVSQAAAVPIKSHGRRLSALVERLYRVDLKTRMAGHRKRVDLQANQSYHLVARRLRDSNVALERIVGCLVALNPLAVLGRGYSVVYRGENEQIVSSVSDVHVGDEVRIRVSDGTLQARITCGEENDHDSGIQSRLDI